MFNSDQEANFEQEKAIVKLSVKGVSLKAYTAYIPMLNGQLSK